MDIEGRGISWLAARLLCVGIVYSASAQAMNYRVVELGNTSFGNSLNDAGQVAGTFILGDPNLLGSLHAFRWVNGAITDLGVLGVDSQGMAINSTGQVAGYGIVAPGDLYPHAFITSASGLIDLGVLSGGAGSYAASINDNGSVTGSANSTNLGNATLDDPLRHAFIYNGGGLVDLGTLTSGGYSYGTSINNSEQVVGYASVPAPSGDTSDSPHEHAFLYVGGTMSDLNPSGASASEAYFISDAGEIAGSVTENGAKKAAIYTNGAWTTLDTVDSSGSGAAALWMNHNGQVVGSSGKGPFLYSNGAAQLILGLIDATSVPAGASPAGGNLSDVLAVEAINDSGWILGMIQEYDVDTRSVVLIPQELTIAPANLSGFSALVGSISNPQVFTITNTGAVAVTVSPPRFDSDAFVATSACGSTLAAGASCSVSVRFSPQTLGDDDYFYADAIATVDGHDHAVRLLGITNFKLMFTASSATAIVNEPITLTWNAGLISLCDVSGGGAGDGWTGAVVGTGSTSTTERSPGQYTYDISCGDPRSGQTGSVTVTFVPPKSSGGGGLDLLTCSFLAGLSAAGAFGKLRQLRHRGPAVRRR